MINRRSFLAAAISSSLAASVSTAQPSSRKRYRACVIGDTRNGGYGHNLHLIWDLHPDVEVVAVADPHGEGGTQHAREARAARAYEDYREMLDRERPDLVSIGPRWTTRHEEYLSACAEVGAHGILEKPLSVDLAEADRMVSAVRQRNLKWSIAFNYGASPITRHVRKMVLEDGLVGDVLELRARGKEDHRAGGEDLIVLGIHCFDVMIGLLGSPLWCSASVTENGRPANPSDVREATEQLGPIIGTRLHAMYGFEGGVSGYFSSMANRHGNQERWGVDIYGSKGIVTFRMTAVPDVRWFPEASWSPHSAAYWKNVPDLPAIHQPVLRSPIPHYAPLVEDLISAIEEDREPVANLEAGRQTTEMIQAVFESHVQGGTQVAIPLEQRDHPLRRWA